MVGHKVSCQLCGWKGKRFSKNTCPSCESKARTRLIPFAMDFFQINQQQVPVLHIAPNKTEFLYIQNKLNPNPYDRLDIRKMPLVNIVQDLTQTTLASNRYQYMLIWHVLEHIPNDEKAILEMYRLLKPGGQLLVSVPIHPNGNPTTFEDPTIPRKDYQEIHGHHDHCRSCGLDYYQRFEKVGFKTAFLHVKDLDESTLLKYGLSENHTAWLFTK